MDKNLQPAQDGSENLLSDLGAALAAHRPALRRSEVGTVTQVSNGIAVVEGLTSVAQDELIDFGHGLMGLAANLHVERLGVILMGPYEKLSSGHRARRTRRVIDVPVGDTLIGRVVDALGRPLDGKPSPRGQSRLPVERQAPPIIARAAVQRPLQTGILSIDAAIPIGRGQRELILGDRQTGKTAIALTAILNQTADDVVAIYCAIGQRGSAVAKVIDQLQRAGAMERTIVVNAAGEDAPGLQFIAPFAATSIAEHLMENGRDVLIVYDDLTRHARAYRELSLLLRRPPGREAYPGDIFFLHSRLLERSTQLRADHGGGSLTALPIIETQAQNISAYIPTNLISITDGQVYLSPELFQKGQLPAIDIGRSVSRVGGKAQLPAYRAVAADLRLAYAQFEELEIFARFGTRLDDDTRGRLERGRRVRQVLKQPEYERLSVEDQLALLLAATQGAFDTLAINDLISAKEALRAAFGKDLSDQILSGKPLAAATQPLMLEAVKAALSAVNKTESGDGDT